MTSRQPDDRFTRAQRPVARALVVAVVALLATLLVTVPGASTGAANTELISNSTFSDGMANWRTGSWGQEATPLVRDGVHMIRLTTSRTQNIVLNDAPNSVGDAGPAGATYQVWARVRTNAPGVSGALRVVERTADGNTKHQETFTLETNGWNTISFRFSTTRPTAELDVSLVAWRLPEGDKVFAQYISMKQVGDETPTPTTSPPTTQPPADDPCSNPVPSGTTFGSSIYPVGISTAESLSQNDAAFGRLPIVRWFHNGMPPKWSAGSAQLLRDRALVISFKATPQAILSGKHDAFLKEWFRTAPAGQTIYWSFHHEPEGEVKRGDFTPDQYRRAWRRLDGFADAACKPNMHATLILSDWATRPNSDTNWRDYDAGKDVIDVIAFDSYSQIWVPNTTVYDSPEQMLSSIVSEMRKDGRPFGIAELGSRKVVGDSDGARRAQWLRRIADYAIANDFTFVTYFQAPVGAEWRLFDAKSQQAWRSYVTTSPH